MTDCICETHSNPDAIIRSVEAPKSQDSHLKPTFSLF